MGLDVVAGQTVLRAARREPWPENVANPPLGPVRVPALVQEHVCRTVGEGVWLDGCVGRSGLGSDIYVLRLVLLVFNQSQIHHCLRSTLHSIADPIVDFRLTS